MWKWIKRLLAIALVGVIGYGGFDYYRAGYHTRPEMPDGAFSISFANGLRAILIDVPNERDARRYFGFPMEVPFYLKDSWSFCHPPTAEEKGQVDAFMERREWPGERFEVVCKVKVDEDVVVRGVITTVPKI